MIPRLYESLPGFVIAGSTLVGFVCKKPGLKKIYSEFISPGDLVFDVGANMGDYSQMFLDLGARVVGFEPQPDCINFLKDKFKEEKNIEIVNQGLGREVTTLPFYVCTKRNTISTFSSDWKESSRFKGGGWDKKIDMPITTLDKMIKKYGKPSFIKIDVEGFEYDVLCGLSSAVPALSLEFGMEYFDSTRKCIKKLMQLGNPQFNLIPFVGTKYLLPEFVTGGQLIGILEKKGKNFGGDIYVKFIQ